METNKNNNGYVTPIIAIINAKGGVGKTTTTVNLAAEFAAKDISVLVVDLDPQGNASDHIGVVSYTRMNNNVGALFTNPDTQEDIAKILETIAVEVRPGFEGVNYIPSAMYLDKNVAKNNSPRPTEELKIRLDLISHMFDVILIDCPPNLMTLTDNAISAATHFIVPIETRTSYSTSGWLTLMEHVEQVARYTNKRLQYLGVLLTCVDSQTKVNKAITEMMEYSSSKFNNSGRVIPVRIRDSIKIGEAAIRNTPVKWIDKSSRNKVAKDYEDLADYLRAELNIRRSYAETNTDEQE
jgi:chromosome partitioning protein